jgi:hypothetical protein
MKTSIPPSAARNLAFSLALPLCFFALPGNAGAADCKAVFDAMLRVATTPHHTYTTLPGVMTGGKPRQSESINTGKAIFLLTEGKWKPSMITPQQTVEIEQDNIKNNKTACRVVRDESVDGVSAILYVIREGEEGEATESQIWISKSSGLPVHVKSDMLDSRYVYSGIVAPAVN